VRVGVWSVGVGLGCYGGDGRSRAAAERVGGVELTYRAFELDPSGRRGGEPLDAYLARKFGGPGAVAASHARLEQIGAETGIDFRWEGKHRANTFDAHRLSAWARATGGSEAQASVAEGLFRAYFTDNADIADHGVLADVAARAGLDRDLATEALATGAFADEVRADERAAAEHEIHSVPSFVIEGRWLIPGAQDVDTFVRVL